MAACTDPGDDGPAAATDQSNSELDSIGLAQTPASLLVLGAGATDASRDRLQRALERLGGGVVESLPPRLVIAQVPAGADAILADLGVTARFDRAVTAADVAGATLDEDRFLGVYSNRWFPSQLQPSTLLAPRKAIMNPNEPFESAPRIAPTAAPGKRSALLPPEPPPFDPTTQVSVPYASGTIVVSIVLPESNGVGEPSTEDWNEQSIRDTYLKVQAALDNIAQSEPNNHLRFIINYESVAGHGNLPGTVDSDVEFGTHAQWNDWTNESTATANVLSKILGHAVDPNDVFLAAYEYDYALRNRYHADGAFFVMVAANDNWTAGLRAHAWIGGPWTVLSTSYGWETFNHEFGHIMGANDEYCPDACQNATGMQGYLGIFNANATFIVGGDGINNGQGEDEPSLMNSNVPSAINGYTRASWGWLDVDGDGVIDVLDTVPHSALSILATNRAIRATGNVVDQPQPRMWGATRYSANRIDALEYRIGDSTAAPWFKVALPADTRGSQLVDVALGELPAGTRPVWIRAINSAGNAEPAQRLMVTTTGTGNNAPRARLELDRAIASTGATVTLHTIAADVDGDAMTYRFDRDGDGTFETAYGTSTDVSFKPARAGILRVGVQVKDSKGKTTTATTELLAFAADAPPAIAIAPQPSIVHGSRAYPAAMTATATDPEGGALQYRWLVDDATTNGTRHTATDWSSSPALATALETPTGLASTPLDLVNGDYSLAQDIRQVIALDANTLAIAGGWKGIWLLDITNRQAPVVISQLALETNANRLVRDGNRLWVLGALLTVVDIHDFKAPKEITQLLTARATRVMSDLNAQGIAENQEVWGQMYDQFGAKITDTRIDVTIDHPQPADLKITLFPPKQFSIAPIVLWDHKAATGGLRTLTFSSTSMAALKVLNGHFASETWQVQIIDDNANGVTGQLISSKITFQTAAKAVPVLASPSRIMVLGGNKLAVAGEGLETLDATFPQLVQPLAMIKGTPAQDAFAVGSRVVWMGPLAVQVKTGTPPPPPPLRGLAVIDASFAFFPNVTRTAVDVGGDAIVLAHAGSRMYVRVQPTTPGCTGKGCDNGQPAFTQVGNTSSFVSCSSAWKLGTTPLFVDPTAFGDNKTMWAINDQGRVAQYDVTSPGAIVRTAEYPRQYGTMLAPLVGAEVLLWQWGTSAMVMHTDQVISTASRVYRLTIEARDPAGNVSRAARTVHVIPYDHAPTITSVTATPGATSADPWTFHLVAADPDFGQLWDNQTFARADWDGDGSWDSDWVTLANGKSGPIGTGDLTGSFAPGHYDVVIQVRDGYWAQATQTVAIDVK